MPTWLNILIACIGFGAGSEAIRRYRAYKQRRRASDPIDRNNGFWTDRRISEAEYAFIAVLLGAPWTMIVLAVATNGRLEWTYLALLGFPLGIYLIMYGMNAPSVIGGDREGASRKRNRP